jgi:hypothetical protein
LNRVNGNLARTAASQRNIAVKTLSMTSKISGAISYTSARAAVIALALAAGVTAGLAAGTEAQRQACTGDVFRLCSSDIPNVDRIVACLKRERTKLSPACQAVFGSETASATRSMAVAAETKEWCTFDPGAADAVNQNWKNWCGTAAR